MNHHTTADFWECYARLPEAVQQVADRHYALPRADPRHPSLHFKKVAKPKPTVANGQPTGRCELIALVPAGVFLELTRSRIRRLNRFEIAFPDFFRIARVV